MSRYTIYHNPRCSKSRQTLELLIEKQLEPRIVEYLQTPPSEAELTSILQKLGVSARAIIRSNEAEYQASGLDNQDLGEAQIIRLMVANPKLIERPIVVKGDRAVVGRPPENVRKLF